MVLDSRLKAAVEQLIDDLVAARFQEVAMDGRGGRLSESMLREAVSQYGCTLVALPEKGWNLVHEYPIDSKPGTLWLDIPLWTKEEGRSDLTLKVAATKVGEKYRTEILDLLVM